MKCKRLFLTIIEPCDATPLLEVMRWKRIFFSNALGDRVPPCETDALYQLVARKSAYL